MGISVLCLAGLSSVGYAAPVKLVLLHHIGEPNTNSRLQTLLSDLATKLNFEMEMVTTSDTGLVEKAMVMAAGGIMPDIVRVDQQQIRALTLAGLLEPLDSYIARDRLNVKRDFIPIGVDAFSYAGHLYALPAENSSNALYYNKTMFNNAGLPYPTTDWAANTWTWDEFVAAAQRLTVDTNGDGKPEQYGIGNMSHFYFYPWLWGADWLDPEFTTFLGDRPEVIAALEKMAAVKLQFGAVGGSFANATAAMNINGNWDLNGLRQSTLDWDLAAWPKGTQRTTVFFPNGFAISKTSKNKELAWEIIKYLTTNPEGVRGYTDIVNRVPSHRALWDYYLRVQESYFKGKANHVFIQALNYGKIWQLRYATNWSQIDKAIRAQWDRAWRGEIPVATAMRQAAPTVNALLKEAQLVKPVGGK